jgi:uncharacterized protein (DUF433 family)/DNA-binding transcriptional MerR regulator
MGNPMNPPPTAIGHYTPAEVGRLAGVSSRRIGQWARHEIILPSVSQHPNIYSYADAGEAVLTHYLVDEGMKPRDLRQIIPRLRHEYGAWPLARAPLFHEGKLLLVKRPDGLYDIKDPAEAKVMKGTFVDLRAIRDALSRGGWVAYKTPRHHIEVDPDRHSGEPVIRGRRIATSRVASLAELPEGRKTLRDDFGLTDAEIDDAIEYERDVAALAA